jgi:hypothetical protein
LACNLVHGFKQIPSVRVTRHRTVCDEGVIDFCFGPEYNVIGVEETITLTYVTVSHT